MYGVTRALSKGGEAGSVSGTETGVKCWLGVWQTEWRGNGSLHPQAADPRERLAKQRWGMEVGRGDTGTRWGGRMGTG